jgi:hypothetical protein
LVSCAGEIYQSIGSDHHKSIDFSICETYACLNNQKSQQPRPYSNEITDFNFINFVNDQLAVRNYSSSENDSDLLFRLVLSDEQKAKTITTLIYPQHPPNTYKYYNKGNHRWKNNNHNNYNHFRNAFQISKSIVEKNFNIPNIKINVTDGVSNKSVWTGLTKVDVYGGDYVKGDIHLVVMGIMKRYAGLKDESKKV